MNNEEELTKHDDSESKTRLENKRALFLDRKQPRKRLPFWAVLVLLASVGTVGYFVVRNARSAPTASPVTKSQNPGAPAIRIPIADLALGKAKFFDYRLSNNTPVRFFAVKSSDGNYRAAMDACEVCFHAKKGYRQEGDDMVCNNCGKHFPLTRVGEINNGCHPIGLQRTVEGEQLVIQASELESRGHYFR
ncbi:MAG: DUF2318 domain-containing protein [Acidobacteria bacterium]|nr:DUF2318 domain-containing protein [Acidobacteriota bacterium]